MPALIALISSHEAIRSINIKSYKKQTHTHSDYKAFVAINSFPKTIKKKIEPKISRWERGVRSLHSTACLKRFLEFPIGVSFLALARHVYPRQRTSLTYRHTRQAEKSSKSRKALQDRKYTTRPSRGKYSEASIQQERMKRGLAKRVRGKEVLYLGKTRGKTDMDDVQMTKYVVTGAY